MKKIIEKHTKISKRVSLAILSIIGIGIILIGILIWALLSGQLTPSANKISSQSIAPLSLNQKNERFGLAGLYSADDLQKSSELGAKYSRPEVVWDRIENPDNQFNFGTIDNGYNLLKNYNLEPMISLRAGKGWGTSCGPTPQTSASCPPKDLKLAWSDHGYSELYYDFVYKTLEHMFSAGKPIEYIIVENEVNTAGFWDGTPEQYTKTRGTVWKAVKDFNLRYVRSVKVIDNGIASDVWGNAIIRELYCPPSNNVATALDFANRWYRRIYPQPITEDDLQNPEFLDCNNPQRGYLTLKEVFKKEQAINEPTFDYMSYHFYEPWETQLEVINWIKQEMEKNGYQRTLIHSEGGYIDKLRTYQNSGDILKQDIARDVIKNHLVAFANGVEKWIWYPLKERVINEPEDEKYKGLYTSTGDSLPASTTYQLLTQKIKSFTQIEKRNFGQPALYIYKITFNSHILYILWNDAPEASPTTIDFSSELNGQIKITKTDGTSQIAESSNLQVSTSPIFVESPDIRLEKQADKTQASPGEYINYVIYYSVGNNPVNNVKIEEYIPAGATYVPGSASSGGIFDGAKLVWDLGNLVASFKSSVSFQVQVK